MAEDVTAVPYIGEETKFKLRRGMSRNMKGKKLTPRRAANMNKNVLQVKLDRRQRKELAKYVGDPENSLLTRQERQEMAASTQSGTTDPGDTIRRGDFRVDRELYKEGQEMHQGRSERAQDVDEQRRARVTTDFSQWANNMGAFDYPGIDTPSRRNPRREEKDRGFVDNNSLLRPFEDEPDEDETEYDTFTAAVFGATLSDGFKVKDDSPGGGSGLGTGIRKQIKEKTEEFGISPDDASKTNAVAEFTIQKPADQPFFNSDKEIAGSTTDTDLTTWEF